MSAFLELMQTLRRGASVESLEKFQALPARKRGKPQLHEAASLSAYVKLHKTPGSRLFADLAQRRFVCVLDHHTPGGDAADDGAPGWGEHVATYACRLTDEWVIWTDKDGHGMKQAEFAEFLEDNLPDVANPDGADLLEMVKNLQASTGGQFDSKINLSNGSINLEYRHEVDARGTTGKGQLVIPEAITLALKPFQGADTQLVPARLRVRVSGALATFLFILDRPDDVLEKAFRAEAEAIATVTGLSVLYGAP